MVSANIPFHRYAGNSIASVAQWVMASLGLEPFEAVHPDLPRLGEIERIVLLVIDGLGASQLEEFSSFCPYMAALPDIGLHSTFPSTTASALTSLCTGVVPACHGIVGYVFRSPVGLLNVVKYAVSGRDVRPEMDPVELQPVPTLFERVTGAGATSWVVTADNFQGSGFTNVFLRGAQWCGWHHPEEMPSIVHDLLPLGMRSLVYAYFDGLDTAGHVSGVGSPQYITELARCDAIAEGIGSALGRGEALIVLSDHGMVNIPSGGQYLVDSELDLICSGIGGEARCRYFYAKPGRELELLEAAKSRYSEWAWVVSGVDAVGGLLFGGEMRGDLVTRVGDVVVIAREPSAGLFRPGRNRPYPKGNHGSVTGSETQIPFRLKLG